MVNKKVVAIVGSVKNGLRVVMDKIDPSVNRPIDMGIDEPADIVVVAAAETPVQIIEDAIAAYEPPIPPDPSPKVVEVPPVNPSDRIKVEPGKIIVNNTVIHINFDRVRILAPAEGTVEIFPIQAPAHKKAKK